VPATCFLRASGLALTLVLGAALAGCGSGDDDDDDASACADAQDLATEIRALGDLDLRAVGTDGLREQLDDVDEEWQELEATGDEQFGDELDDVEASVQDLVDTIRGVGDSDAALSSIIGEIEDDMAAIATSWERLAAAVQDEFEDCELTEPSTS
jgi:hypothetical protein